MVALAGLFLKGAVIEVVTEEGLLLKQGGGAVIKVGQLLKLGGYYSLVGTKAGSGEIADRAATGLVTKAVGNHPAIVINCFSNHPAKVTSPI